MKIFKLMMIALVAMCGLNSCSDDCNHDFIEYDYTQDLVGTWTCMDMDYAEAMVIKADGSVEVTGVVDHEYFESKGTIKVVNNKMIYKLDNGDEFEGRFEMTKGESFTMVWDDELDIRYTYRYCENDLADELVGMWISNDGPTDMENEIMIRTYDNDGKVTTTGVITIGGEVDWTLGEECEYKVVGNLLFKKVSEGVANQLGITHNVEQLIYTPKATELGDIMTVLFNFPSGDGFVESRSSFLRVKQSLNLTGKTYDYNSAYVTNAKGVDEDFSITGSTFNMANIKAGDFDMLFRAVLFCVEFPNANTIKQHFLVNGIGTGFETPIIVEGNKVTLDMSAGNPAFRKVEMYMFQDKDDSQLHMYMPTSSFINYFANLEFVTLLTEGKIDPTDAAAVEKVFADMEARVESINVSFVLKARE